MSAATPHRIDPPSFALSRADRDRGAVVVRSQGVIAAADDSASPADKNPPSEPGDPSGSAVGDLLRVDPSHRIGDDLRTDLRTMEWPLRDQWLRFHASDLIEQLQGWASDLDAREAHLNARLAVQDHRERQFRMQQQDVSAEMAERQRSLRRLQEEIQSRCQSLHCVESRNPTV